MATLKTVLTIIFIILSVFITIVILMQEGKSGGLGALNGTSETYWSKNKGRSLEGILVKVTTVAVFLFMALAVVLCLGIW